MEVLTATMALTRRGGLAAFAIAMLTSLAAMCAPAQAQGFNFDAGFRFKGGVSVGLAAGQTINIVIDAADSAGNSLNKPSESPGVIVGAGSRASAVQVKAFNAATGALLWSRELTSLTAGLHIFGINRDELPEVGDPVTRRVQLWIGVVIVGRDARRGGAGENVSPPIFEVFENLSGATTVRGEIRQTRPIVFTGLE